MSARRGDKRRGTKHFELVRTPPSLPSEGAPGLPVSEEVVGLGRKVRGDKAIDHRQAVGDGGIQRAFESGAAWMAGWYVRRDGYAHDAYASEASDAPRRIHEVVENVAGGGRRERSPALLVQSSNLCLAQVPSDSPRASGKPVAREVRGKGRPRDVDDHHPFIVARAFSEDGDVYARDRRDSRVDEKLDLLGHAGKRDLGDGARQRLSVFGDADSPSTAASPPTTSRTRPSPVPRSSTPADGRPRRSAER